jgi:hypothetical protein
MTTAQESTNGHRVLPPPFSIENPGEPKPADLPTDKANINHSATDAPVIERPIAANAYHVPPARYAPKAYAYRRDDTLNLPPETTPLPERCQFMFSDGRQCTMGRSEIHPSLCPYHSEREDQLFGTPSSGGSVVGAGFDLPELHSACRDLTTASGVNRALAQVFRLLAQRRISRQEAATFAKLGQLLLQSISAAHSESTDPASPPRKGYQQDALFAGNDVVPSSGESHGHQELSPVDKVDRERGASPALLPHNKADVAATSEDSLPQITRPSLDAPPAVSHALSEPTPAKTSSGINTSATPACNSPEISTYENVELKAVQNQHLHNNVAGAAVRHSDTGKASRRR